MSIKTNFPHATRLIEHIWILLADGLRLSARIWLPVDAEVTPVPALLEYIPYRKDDWTAPRDSLRHPYLAGHGYACVRVDLWGSGDSEGLLLDEYLKQEQDDALEVIAWIAAQQWCTGSVGMFGKSWGGFNALQVAARLPPALKAILTFYSTDDRYTDDIHYIGGCNFGTEHVSWASTMLAFNARPPDPRQVGDRWREMWLDRLNNTPPYINEWLTHQRRDEFWKHGSVNEDYAAITCAVYAVGGWADGYTNAVPRLLANLTCPRKGIIGPWAHQYPETSIPGPAVGFLQESLRWWDYWLKGIDTGIMAEPLFRVWLQESALPMTLHPERPGRWVAETVWPSPPLQSRRFRLDGGRLLDLDDSPQELETRDAAIQFCGSQLCGFEAGMYYSMSVPGDEPPDQRAEDGLSLCFDSEPLADSQDVLGFPELTLTLSVDRPQALIAARLCDVAPTGESLLVSRGLLNLTHRDGHETPRPLLPDQKYTVKIQLKITGHSIKAGHKWRLALSPTYFPWAWPSPQPVTLTLFPAESQFALPIRPPRAEDTQLAPFGPPETSAPIARDIRRAFSRSRRVQRDLVTGRVELIDFIDTGSFRFLADDLEYDETTEHTFAITEGDPLSAVTASKFIIAIGRGDWRVWIETNSSLRSDLDNFYTLNEVQAFEGETPVFSRNWSAKIARAAG